MGRQNYLDTAFNRAREANPQATLVINDYVTTDDYLEKVISQLVDASGQPLFDVIGIQCHQHEGAWSAEKTWDICERFAKAGKPLHFTEATILSGQPGMGMKREAPGVRLGDGPLKASSGRRKKSRSSTPSSSAIPPCRPSPGGTSPIRERGRSPAGLVRADMTPKPAYDALMRLIKGKWWTRTEVRTSRDGAAQFHGFYGDYKVSVEEHGRELTGTFTL